MYMYIAPIIITIVGIVLIIIGIIVKRNEKIIIVAQNEIEGTVIRYASTTANPPLVEYEVDKQKYRRALRYSMVIYNANPFKNIKANTNDIFATTLRITSNSNININTMMRDNFPVGSKMKVFYNENNPKLSYVERYAKNMLPTFFIIGGVFSIVCSGLLFFLISFVF